MFTFFSLFRVCKKWNELTMSSVFWKQVYLKFDYSHKSQNTVTRHCIRILPPCVTRLSLDFGYSFTWTEHLNFEEFCVKLEGRCPHLEMLIVKGAILSISLPVVIDLCTLLLRNVKILIIRCSKFSKHSLKNEFSCTSKVEVLDFSRCYLNGSPAPPFSRMPHLKQLLAHDTAFQGVDLFEDDVTVLNQLHLLDLGLTYVDSRRFQRIRDHGINLKILCISSAHITDDDFNFSNMSVFPHLKTICLRYCRHVTCRGVVSLIRGCRTLQNVYVKRLVAANYIIHPFIVGSPSKLGIVKVISDCNNHRTEKYLWD